MFLIPILICCIFYHGPFIITLQETAPEWKTKTPVESVASYLSKGGNFKKGENGVWTLQNVSEQDDSDECTDDADEKQQKADDRGLYFITLSPYIKICGAGRKQRHEWMDTEEYEYRKRQEEIRLKKEQDEKEWQAFITSDNGKAWSAANEDMLLQCNVV